MELPRFLAGVPRATREHAPKKTRGLEGRGETKRERGWGTSWCEREKEREQTVVKKL
jgi:hypothetical protein